MRSPDCEAQKDYIAVLQLSKRQRMYCTIRMQVAYDLPPLPPKYLVALKKRYMAKTVAYLKILKIL